MRKIQNVYRSAWFTNEKVHKNLACGVTSVVPRATDPQSDGRCERFLPSSSADSPAVFGALRRRGLTACGRSGWPPYPGGISLGRRATPCHSWSRRPPPRDPTRGRDPRAHCRAQGTAWSPRPRPALLVRFHKWSRPAPQHCAAAPEFWPRS